jgi:hypothetical protein
MENYDFSKLLPNLGKLKQTFEKVSARVMSSHSLKYFLHRCHPGAITRNERTCKHWDKKLLRILNNPISISRENEYWVKINGDNIWVANYPYAYGSPDNNREGLPSRSTVVKLRMVVDALDEKLKEEMYK